MLFIVQAMYSPGKQTIAATATQHNASPDALFQACCAELRLALTAQHLSQSERVLAENGTGALNQLPINAKTMRQWILSQCHDCRSIIESVPARKDLPPPCRLLKSDPADAVQETVSALCRHNMPAHQAAAMVLQVSEHHTGVAMSSQGVESPRAVCALSALTAGVSAAYIHMVSDEKLPFSSGRIPGVHRCWHCVDNEPYTPPHSSACASSDYLWSWHVALHAALCARSTPHRLPIQPYAPLLCCKCCIVIMYTRRW